MRQIPRPDLDRILVRAEGDFAALRGARVLVTGATGFVGSWMMESAAHATEGANARLELFALVPPGVDLARAAPHLAALRGVTVLQGDIRTLTAEGLAAQCGGTLAFDAVIHAAISVDAATIATDPFPTLDSAVDGTRRTLEVARASGARRFLFLSSGAVYGRQPIAMERMPETYRGGPDTMDPAAVYAEGKRIGEMMCACAARAHGIEAVVARAFAFVGPHLPLDRHFAVGNFMRDALRGGPVTVRGDGTAERSYMHAADMATWLWALLARGEAGRAYNVGASRRISIAELARLVAGTVRPACGVEVLGTPVTGAAIDRYLPDVSRARDSLGLEETVALEEAVASTLRWHGGAT